MTRPTNLSQWARTRARINYLLLIMSMALPAAIFAEGTPELNPNGTAGNPCGAPNTQVGDLAMLCIQTNQGGFATYGTYGTTQGLCFEVKNPGEVVYIALSQETNSDGTCDGGFDWRIVGPSGVASGPNTLDATNSNGDDLGPIIIGPDAIAAGGYDTSGPYTFVPMEVGLYCIEFDGATFGTTDGYLRNFDITVADAAGGTPIDGRVFSQNWSIRTPCTSPMIACQGDPAVLALIQGFRAFQNPFEGTVYAITDDNFVQQVDFSPMGSGFATGFRGLTFRLAFNINGPGSTGDVILDRQSKDGADSTAVGSTLFPVFLNEPDPACYEEGRCGEITVGPLFSCDDPLCIEYEVTEPGLLEFFIDLDGPDGVFTPNSTDVFLAERVVDIGDLEGCIPWDGLDGDGNVVDLQSDVQILSRYSQGEIHFMQFDVENNNPGWTVDVIDPPCAMPDFNLFWDDSQLDPNDNASGQASQPLVSLLGSPQPNHIWEDQEDASALGFGESNTINTWFFASVDNAVDIVTCMPMIMLEKTGTFVDENMDGVPQVGETITYTFTVTNTGDTRLTNIMITDPIVTIMGGPIALDPMQSDNTTFTGTYTFDAAGIMDMMIMNTATVVGSDPNGGTVMDMDDFTFMFSLNAEIKVTKEGVIEDTDMNGLIEPGDMILYTFEVTNCGDVTLTNIVIVDPLITVTGNPIATLALGASSTAISGSYPLTQDEIDAGMYENQATVTGTDPGGEPVDDLSDDPNDLEDVDVEGDDEPDDPTVVIIPQTASITITKTSDISGLQSPPQPGDIILYTFEVCNTGTVTLTDITVNDPLVSVTGGPMITLAPMTCDNMTFSGSFTIDSDDIASGGVMNTATTMGTDPSGETVDDMDDENVMLESMPGIGLTKIADASNLQSPPMDGDIITYTFEVCNTGNVDLTNVTVSDPMVTVMGTSITLLTVNACDNMTFTGTYSIDQSDIDAAMFMNTAMATGFDPNGEELMDDSEQNVPLNQSPAIEVIKNGVFNDENMDGIAQEFETITYMFIVQNTGNVTLTNIVINDPLVTITGGPIASLAPDAIDNMTFTGTYSLSQQDVDDGSVMNTATVTGMDPGGEDVENMDDEETFYTQFPEIMLFKSSVFDDNNMDGLAQPGETITYTFTVTNTGNVTLTNIMITDPLFAVAGTLASLAPNASDNTTFTGTYVIDQDDINVGEVPNTATVNGTDPNGDDVEDMDDELTSLPAVPAIMLVKNSVFNDTNMDGLAQVGETITYTFTITNTGNVTLFNVILDDPLLTIVGNPIPVLLPGAVDNTTYTGTVILDQDDIDAGQVDNTAIVMGTTLGDEEVMDPDTEMTDLPQMPGIELIKTGSFNDTNMDGFGQVGETITYTFTVTNIGNVTLTNVNVTDNTATVTGGPILSLAPQMSDNTTFTATYILTQDDIDNGEVLNIANSTGSDPDGTPVMDPDDDETEIPQNPGIELIKMGTFNDLDGNGLAEPGETITYTFIVENVGNVTLTNITLSDPLLMLNGGSIPSLAPGAIDNLTFSGTYTLTQDDVDAGIYENTAEVSGNDPNGDPVTDPDTEETDLPQMPMIDIIKSGVFNDENMDGIPQLGETLTYMFIVENTGNVTLTNITITDPLVTVIGGPIVTLAPGDMDNTTFTGTYTLTQQNVDDGSTMNTATVMGMDPDGTTVDDLDDEDTDYTRDPEIMLIKTGVFEDVNSDNLAQPGEAILYTFTVTNIGNVTLTDITIDDPLFNVIGGPIPSLIPGEMDDITFTGTYILDQADIDGGNIDNTATVSGFGPDGTEVMDPDTEETALPIMPELELIKTSTFIDGNGDGIAQVGEQINYSFVVTNTGNVTITNISITDPILTVSGGILASLAPGIVDNTTFSGVYILTQTDIDNGEVMNTATVMGMDPNGEDVEDPDEEVTEVPQMPGIELVKTSMLNDANGDGISQPGETISYTFTITNTGNVTLTNVMVSDPLLMVMGTTIASLAPGVTDNTTFSGEYILTQNDIDNGQVVNMANVMGIDPNGDPTEDPDDETTDTPQSPSIEVEKIGVYNDENGDGLAQPGESISYTFVIENTGNVTLTNIMVSDPLITVSGGTILSLAPGEIDNSTFMGTYLLNQMDVDNGEVENTATVNATDPNGDDVDDMDTEVTDFEQESGLTIVKTSMFNDLDGDGLAEPGETISYSFVVTNVGNVTITNITITDPLISVMGSLSTLAPGDSDNTTFSGTYTLDQDDVDNGEVVNTATVNGLDPDGTPTDNTDDEDTPLPIMPGIDIIKIGLFNDENGDGIAQPGESISYTFVIMNTGNVTLTNIVVDDPIITVSGGPLTSLAPGAMDNTTFSGTYILDQDDVDSGSVMNMATVSGMDPNGDEVEDVGDEDTPFVQNPDISILKTSSLNDENGDGIPQPGETISYAFVIINTGNVTLTDITVSDPVITVMGGPIASLAPGTIDNQTFAGTYVLLQIDIDNGELINTATVTGTDPNGEDETDDSDDPNNPEDIDPNGDGDPDDPTTTFIPQIPDITIFKTGTFNDENGDGLAQPGETVSYVFTVINTGNVTLTNVTVEDPLITVDGTVIPQLSPGQSDNTTFSGTFVLTQIDIDNGEIVNTATATGLDPDGTPEEDDSDDPTNPADVDPDGDGDPDDPTIVDIPSSSRVTLLKIGTFNDLDGDGFANVGESITYQFTVENTGTVTLTNISLSDPNIIVNGGPIPILSPGQIDNTTFSGTYILTLNDVLSLGVENQAEAFSQDPDGNEVTDLSDDPNNPTDVDVNDDGDPDDPTIVPICGIKSSVTISGDEICFDENGVVVSAIESGDNLIPFGFEVFYVLTSSTNQLVQQVGSGPSFTVFESDNYTIYILIAETSDPTDPNYIDLDEIELGITSVQDVINEIAMNDLCAALDVASAEVIVQPCNVNLIKEQTDVLFFEEDEDVRLSFELTVSNNGAYDIKDLALQDPLPFFPNAFPSTPINATNVELSIENNNATELPELDFSYTGFGNNTEMFDGNSGYLRPGESFVVTIITEVDLERYRDINPFQINTGFVQGIALNSLGEELQEVDDISDDPTILDNEDVDNDGDPDDPTPIFIPVCDELVCNLDLVISLGSNCELEVTADILLEAPELFGDYEITFFDADGNDLGNVLSSEVAGFYLTFQVDCGTNSCWGTALIESNATPDFDAPCECTEDGSIPEECTFWCGDNFDTPDLIITPEEVELAFEDCGPELVGNIVVKETRSGDLCEEGEIVTITYRGKVKRHGRFEEIDILCQSYTIEKLDIDVSDNEFNDHFGYPDDLIIDCNYLDQLEGDFELGSPESIEALTGDGILAYTYFVDAHRTVIDTNFVADTIQIIDESQQILRDTMVQQDVDGDGVLDWVRLTVVDKALKDTIIIDTIIGGEVHPLVPIKNQVCNILVTYNDVTFEACGNGTKILREWTLVDWCNSDITQSARQTIEIRDISSPQVVVDTEDGPVPVTMLNDLMVSIEPWTCSAKLQLPQLNIVDNCDPEPTVEWTTIEGRIDEGFIFDLWKEQSPVKVIATITDDCNNATELSFNVIIQDMVPPVPIATTDIQVSLTGDANGGDALAKIYAENLDEGSHDAGCGAVELYVVRMEDWSDPVTDCLGNIVGYRPVSCSPETEIVDIGQSDFKAENCQYDGVNLQEITVPGEFVKFCCEDVGQEVMVILIVKDAAGNTNQAMIRVEVVDKATPILFCEDIEIDCGDQLFEVAGPRISGGLCGAEEYNIELINEIDRSTACGAGNIEREWFVDLDGDGTYSIGDLYCMQIVTITDESSRFDPYTIKWPKHYDGSSVVGTNLECNPFGSITETEQTVDMGQEMICMPDAESGYKPVWCDTECGLIGYTMDQDTIEAGDACIKIIRRWSVVDWCVWESNGTDVDDENDTGADQFEAVTDWAQGVCANCDNGNGPAFDDSVYFRYTDVDEDGYYTFDQVIKVIDESKPTIEFEDIVYIDIFNGAESKDDNTACSGSGMVSASASDFCDGVSVDGASLRWEVHVTNSFGEPVNDASGTNVKFATGSTVTMDTRSGGVGDIYTVEFIVEDGCGNSEWAATTIIFRDAKPPTPFCVSGLTTAFMDDNGQVTVWANEFDFGSFDNCCPSDQLRFSIVPSGQTPISPSDNNFGSEGSITFNCEEYNDFALLDVWVWDCDGNGDFCTVNILIDNDCEGAGGNGSSGMISGNIATEAGIMVNEATVSVLAGLPEYPYSMNTGANGIYAFQNNPLGVNYTISTEKNDLHTNGVSTMDLVFIQRHILGEQLLDSPYKVIAADVSNDERISSLDIFEIKKLILGIDTEFSMNESWRFVDAEETFFDDLEPWPFTEKLNIINFSQNMMNENFIGVKIGDVTGDVKLENSTLVQNRSNKSLDFEIKDKEIKKGEVVLIEFTSKNIDRIFGFQFTLHHKGLRFLEVPDNQIKLGQNDFASFDDKMTFSWFDEKGKDFSTLDNVVFTLNFIANKDLKLSDVLQLSSSITASESYLNDPTIVSNIGLKYSDSEIQNDFNLTLFQNEPNPFNESTVIGFNLPKAGDALITVFDLNGQKVFSMEKQFGKGYNEVLLLKSQINKSGLLYYQVSQDELQASKKMLIMN